MNLVVKKTTADVLLIGAAIIVALIAGVVVPTSGAALLLGIGGAILVFLLALKTPFAVLLLVTFLIPIEPFTTFEGASLNRYITIALLLGWIAYYARERCLPRLPPAFLGMSAWFVFGLISYLWAPTTNRLAENAFGYLQALILMAVAADMVRTRKQLSWLLGALLVGEAIFVAIYLLTGRPDMRGYLLPTIGTVQLSEYGNLIGLVAASYIIFIVLGNFKQISLALLVLLPTGYLFLNTGLRRIILIIAAVVFALLILPRKISWKGVLLLLIISAGVLFFWNTLLEAAPTEVQNRFMLEEIVATGGSGRITIYTLAFRIWSSSPIVGVGLGNFPYYYLLYSQERTNMPHNIFLEVLAETGVVGLLIWAVSFLMVVWSASKIYRMSANTADRLLAGLVLALLVYMLAGGMVSGFTTWRMFWLALGLGIAATKIFALNGPLQAG